MGNDPAGWVAPEDGSVDCCETLLRGVTETQLVWDCARNQPAANFDAFIPRYGKEDSLSVSRRGLTTLASFWERLPNSVAATSLRAGQVRSIGLTVAASPRGNNLAHASIAGMPVVPRNDTRYDETLEWAYRLQALASVGDYRDPATKQRVLRDLRGPGGTTRQA